MTIPLPLLLLTEAKELGLLSPIMIGQWLVGRGHDGQRGGEGEAR